MVQYICRASPDQAEGSDAYDNGDIKSQAGQPLRQVRRPTGLAHPGAATRTPTELTVPEDAMPYGDDGAAMGGKLIVKVGVLAGAGKPLVLLTAVPEPTYSVAALRLLNMTLHGPSGTFASSVVAAVPATA